MSDMKNNEDLQIALTLALSEEYSKEERLQALARLQGLLYEEELVKRVAELAVVEKSIEVRAAMLSFLCTVDFTRLKNREMLIEALVHFAALDAEPKLRLFAIERLTALGNECEPIFAELLVSDMDWTVQEACLDGLLKTTDKSPVTIEKLILYGMKVPAHLREKLILLYQQLPRAHAQSGIAHLLHPAEEEKVKEKAIELLCQYPELLPETTTIILDYAAKEQSSDLRTEALKIIFTSKSLSVDTLYSIFDWIELIEHPEKLLGLLKPWLDSNSRLFERLGELFRQSTSLSLKLAVLRTLENMSSPHLFVEALGDSNPWVRSHAIEWCRLNLEKHATTLQPALVQALKREKIVGLRWRLATLFLTDGRKTAEVEGDLLNSCIQEPDPNIQKILGRVLCDVTFGEERASELLSVFQQLLKNPLVEESIKIKIAERLRSFAYRNEPRLVDCLMSLLDQEKEVEKAEEWVRQLKKLEMDQQKWGMLLLKTFYRFVHHYPRASLHEWLKDFEALAPAHPEIQASIAHIVQLTGESWLLRLAQNTEKKAAFLSTMMEALRKNAFQAPQRLLTDAWNTRTLKKSDLLEVFNWLLYWPQREGALQHIFKIFSDAKLVTPEMLNRCFDLLSARNVVNCQAMVEQYLRQTAVQDPTYRDRVISAFTQSHYTKYWMTSGTLPRDERTRPHDWNSWEYQGWRVPYSDWPIARLYFELNPKPDFRVGLETAVDPSIPSTHTIQYLILHNFWRNPAREASDLKIIGNFMRQVHGIAAFEPLYDRALCVFSKQWNNAMPYGEAAPIDPELTQMAAEAYFGLCQKHTEFLEHPENARSKPQPPKVLEQMDENHLKHLMQSV